MKIYSIFDDYDHQAAGILMDAGCLLTIHPQGFPRPDHDQMKKILEEYDGIIIGTSQKITADMFELVETPRIIATASVGLDHIQIPAQKRALVKVLNTPKANARSVAEYAMACALSCVKRLREGDVLYRAGKNNKALHRKPEDLAGKTIGVVGAGNISVKIMEYARFFGMEILCWTRNPERHRELLQCGVSFVELETLCETADVISVNLPNKPETVGLISAELVDRMKDTAVFISVSRLQTVDLDALLQKAKTHPGFYLCLDLDVNPEAAQKLPDCPNVMVTPHIAGGTVDARKRMFRELAESIIQTMT